ncbi:MAG: hypothetical protein HRT34_03505 [Alcanivorax sp.]|nr:hypothetical protein [Alcanivorax sp.]
MSEFKGTKGPWKARNLGTEIAVFGSYRICGMTGGEIQRDKANAHLIAAAPDLLDALIALRTANGGDNFNGWHQGFDSAIEKARAAIAKAMNTDTAER